MMSAKVVGKRPRIGECRSRWKKAKNWTPTGWTHIYPTQHLEEKHNAPGAWLDELPLKWTGWWMLRRVAKGSPDIDTVPNFIFLEQATTFFCKNDSKDPRSETIHLLDPTVPDDLQHHNVKCVGLNSALRWHHFCLYKSVPPF